MDALRPTSLRAELTALEAENEALRAGTEGVAVLWQDLREAPTALAARSNRARSRLPDRRLLVVVCEYGALQRRPNIRVVELPPKHFALLHPSRPARYRIARGGRGAGKSHSIADVVIVTAAVSPINVGCFREEQNSIRDSVHKLLCDKIHKHGLSPYFDIGVQYIRSHAGAQFLFEGLHGNVNGIRSLEGLDIAWVEEAAGVSETSWEVLIPTIRAPGSQIIANYNPINDDDPTHVRFSINTPPHTLIDHFTFADNPWFPEPLKQEMGYLQRVDDDAFRHVWLGETRKHSDAQILKNKYVVEEFTPQPHWNGPYLGLDFGFSQDPTAAVKCYIADRVLYVSHEVYQIGCDIDRTPALLDSIPEARAHVMRADCSRPETISFLMQHGYPLVVGAEKWAGSVEDGVAHLRSYEKIVIHPRCGHVIEEARLYSFKVDRLSGDVLPEIVDRHNHTMDALRYALSPLIKQCGLGLLGYYQEVLAAEQHAKSKQNPDPNHVVQTTYLNGAKPQHPLPGPAQPASDRGYHNTPRPPQSSSVPLFERAKAEGAVVADLSGAGK
jgi:phage terminase large subunit